MSTSNPSWPFTATSLAALRDELIKIGEAASQPKEKGIGRALRAMGAAGAGAAAGHGLSELVTRNLPYFQPTASPEVFNRRRQLAKIILPIGGALAVMLASRYRRNLNREYGKIEGFGDREKQSS